MKTPNGTETGEDTVKFTFEGTLVFDGRRVHSIQTMDDKHIEVVGASFDEFPSWKKGHPSE